MTLGLIFAQTKDFSLKQN